MDNEEIEERYEDDENYANATVKRWGAKIENSGPQIILEPNHPLMQKFQATYKECLEKENDRLNTEILQLKGSLKKRHQEYEKQMGQEMYQLEQEVSLQRKNLMQYENELKNAAKLRQEKELFLKASKDRHRDQTEKLNACKKNDVDLLGELEALTLLNKQYEAWRKETDSELSINQRISEKLTAEKKVLCEKKKKMDLFVYNVTTEVWKLEAENELLEDQIIIKNEELEAIRNKSSDSTADLEALQLEQNHLIKLWNSVIINIQKKDKAFTNINNNIEGVKNEVQGIVTKIEACKKEIIQEMEKGEELISKRERAVYELQERINEIKNEESKKSNIESSIMEMAANLELQEKDLHLAKIENSELKSNLKSVNMQLEKVMDEKIKLENETLDTFQERLSYDKTTECIANKIKQLKDISRKQEINILKNENKNAKILFSIEKQKVRNNHQDLLVEEDKKLCLEAETEISVLESKLKEVILNIERNKNNLDLVNKKISMILARNKGKEISPIELKIDEYEIQIEEKAKKMKTLQQDWLRMQQHCVQLTENYQKQLKENNLLKERLQIVERKKIKIDNIINTQKQEINDLQHVLDDLQYRIDHLSKQVCQEKEQNIGLEAKYNTLTFEFTASLKDAEMQAMLAEEDIRNLEDEKKQLTQKLHDLKREVLSWQKMGMMAMETKDNVNKDRISGEVNKMKTEIHRMQVRKGQVLSTAARLATDLAQAVGRRVAATSKAKASARSAAPRHTFLTKIKEKRAEIRRINQDIDINRAAIDECLKEREKLQMDAEERNIELSEIENEIEELKKHIDDSQLLKHQNLEKIIRYQRYSQYCTSITCGRTKILTQKSEVAINMEYEKQKKLNMQLSRLARKLLQDIPEQSLNLVRTMNTLNMEDLIDTN